MDELTQQRLEAEVAARSPELPNPEEFFHPDGILEAPPAEPGRPEELPDYRLPGPVAHATLEYLSTRPYREVAWLMDLLGNIEQL